MFRKRGRQSLIYSGGLDRYITLRIEIEVPVTDMWDESPGSANQDTVVAAHRVPKDGGEGLEQDRDTATSKTIFEIRYFPGLNTKYSVLEDVDGTLDRYNIKSVIELGRREGMRLICEAQK